MTRHPAVAMVWDDHAGDWRPVCDVLPDLADYDGEESPERAIVTS